MKNEMNNLLKAINDDFVNCCHQSGYKFDQEMVDNFKQNLSVNEGNKYYKVVSNNSAWGFVVKTDKDTKFAQGDILMAKNWNSPARNKARGNVFNDNYNISWSGAV